MKEAKININTSYSLCETAVKYLSHHNLCVLRLSKDADRICWKMISKVRNVHSWLLSPQLCVPLFLRWTVIMCIVHCPFISLNSVTKGFSDIKFKTSQVYYYALQKAPSCFEITAPLQKPTRRNVVIFHIIFGKKI